MKDCIHTYTSTHSLTAEKEKEKKMTMKKKIMIMIIEKRGEYTVNESSFVFFFFSSQK